MPKKLVSHNHLKKSEYIFLAQPFWANSVKEIVSFVLLTDKIFACVRDYCNMDLNLFDIFCKIATRKNLLKPWYTLAPINTRPISSVWSKIGTFQKSLVNIKSATLTFPTKYVFTTIESFKMRYCMEFYLKGHRNYEKANFWLYKFTK